MENFLPRKFRYETNPAKADLGVIYPEVITWYGALTFADLSKDQALTDRLISKFQPFLTEEGAKHINQAAHVDYRVFGAVPFQLYRQTGEQKYLDLGKHFADAQWSTTGPDGLTTESRYWIDDMYMIPLLQTQAYRATGDKVYLDRAAQTMAAYFDRLQKENGLFHHGLNEPFFWGRGNGWMAAGSTEALRSMPADHSLRGKVLAGYQKLMATLLKTQGEDGLWGQLLDVPDAWRETSGSAMFTFAFVTGVKNGWLDEKTYAPAARKAWIALCGQLDEKANLAGVCIGTNKGNTAQFYLDRERATGDLHGQAPMLWTASALLRDQPDPTAAPEKK